MKWPDDYWPKHPAPPNAAAWDEAIASFKRERDKFKTLARDTPDLYALVPTERVIRRTFAASCFSRTTTRITSVSSSPSAARSARGSREDP